MRVSRLAPAFVALASLITSATAHSWVQQLNNIGSNGSFVGKPGFPRGYVPQFNNTHWDDKYMVYLLPPNGQPNVITDSLNLCKDTQRTYNQTAGFARLQATPGSWIALQYQENGHVTQPNINAGKAPNGGTVYIYGTSDPKVDEKFNQVHNVWNTDGTGGDKRGKLIATRDFDDLQCYQDAPTQPLAQQRAAAHPILTSIDPQDDALWCQNDFPIPKDVPIGKPYTLYWIWDWPTTGLAKGLNKLQSYQTCMDVDVVAPATTSNKAMNAQNLKINAQEVNLNYAGIVSQLTAKNILATPAPAVSPSVAASNPAASPPGATPMSISPTAPAAPAPSLPSAAAPGISSTSVMTITITPTITVQPSQASSAAPIIPMTSTTVVMVTIHATTTVAEGAPAAASSSSSAVMQASQNTQTTISGNFFQTQTTSASSPSAPSATGMSSNSNCTKTAKLSKLFGGNGGNTKTPKRGFFPKVDHAFDNVAQEPANTLNTDAATKGEELNPVLGRHGATAPTKRSLFGKIGKAFSSAIADVGKAKTKVVDEIVGRGLAGLVGKVVSGAVKAETEIKDKVHLKRGLNRLERAREMRGE